MLWDSELGHRKGHLGEDKNRRKKAEAESRAVYPGCSSDFPRVLSPGWKTKEKGH